MVYCIKMNLESGLDSFLNDLSFCWILYALFLIILSLSLSVSLLFLCLRQRPPR